MDMSRIMWPRAMAKRCCNEVLHQQKEVQALKGLGLCLGLLGFGPWLKRCCNISKTQYNEFTIQVPDKIML